MLFHSGVGQKEDKSKVWQNEERIWQTIFAAKGVEESKQPKGKKRPKWPWLILSFPQEGDCMIILARKIHASSDETKRTWIKERKRERETRKI